MKKLMPTKLAPQDRTALTSLTYHPGFQVLVKLMEVRVQQATVAMLDVEPTDEKRAEKLNNLQAQAFARNSYSAELLNDINWQVQQEIADKEANTEDEVDPQTQAMINAATRMGIFSPAGE